MATLIHLLIGHRGVGKTTLARRFKKKYPSWQVFDLDEEIERDSDEKIAQLLAQGESYFRSYEQKVLNKLVAGAQQPTLIALGAGFEGSLPPEARVIWLRRTTDANGRVFLNRPRLDPNKSPYQEFLDRFNERERRFRSWVDDELFIPEGLEDGLENCLLPNPELHIPFDLTLLPHNLQRWTRFWRRRKTWGLRRLELRDDLLSEEQIRQVLEDIPPEQVLLSRRRVHEIKNLPIHLKMDWPVELGECSKPVHILSMHERDVLLEFSPLEQQSDRAEILKLAVEIRDFQELLKGHQWWLKDPKRRAFLPRSPDGRWRWYRSLFGPRMPLHFFREGDGSGEDQPQLWQFLLQTPFAQNFAAVLGHPVEHSLSPENQRAFFAQRGIPFVAIDMVEDEFETAVPVLKDFGLRAAAVTAPLKRKAALLIKDFVIENPDLDGANTLFWDGQFWRGTNTDVQALAQIRHEIKGPQEEVWLWGGSGIKSSVRQVWPQVKEISARQGCEGSGSPDLVIWAVGRSRLFKSPPFGVQPRFILDLNYGADSPGLEWAVKGGFPYQSGLHMFNLQAESQRQFWQRCEGSNP